MANFSTGLSRLLADIAPRTQYALIALGFVLGLSAVLSVGDRVSVMRGEHDVLAKRLAQYGDGIDIDRWESRVRQTDAILTDWQSHYWKGPTAGIIAAQHSTPANGSGTRVILLESPDVPNLGVGEGTWPTMRDTLRRIGLSEVEFLHACDASFKQGS
ncbi:MAG: tryptophan 7-halogenase, partial [Pseudomonadota bacterium]